MYQDRDLHHEEQKCGCNIIHCRPAILTANKSKIYTIIFQVLEYNKIKI